MGALLICFYKVYYLLDHKFGLTQQECIGQVFLAAALHQTAANPVSLLFGAANTMFLCKCDNN